MFKRVPISLLRVGDGVVLSCPIYDGDGTKYIDDGVAVTDRLVQGLKERGIEAVIVDESDLARLTGSEAPDTSERSQGAQPDSRSPEGRSEEVRPDSRSRSNTASPNQVGPSPQPARERFRANWETAASSKLDKEIEKAFRLVITTAEHPFAVKVKTHGTTPYNPELVDSFREEQKHFLDELDPFLDLLAAGKSVDVETVTSICNKALLQVAEDMDLFVSLGLDTSSASYSTGHSLHVAMVAISIGVTMGYDEATLIELGIGCLVHDVGMLKLDKSLYQSPRTLDSSEFSQIVNHPLITLNLLRDKWDEIPKGALFVAYQMHERCNGSGYPRGRSEKEIHDLAKIAAVADTFTALVTPRPHREALLPFHAMRTILGDVKSGLFRSEAVRALLDTVSVYPIGSFVELNNGQSAQVIRVNRGNYTSPIVQVWNQGLDQDPVIIDLANEPKLEVSRCIAEPKLAPA